MKVSAVLVYLKVLVGSRREIGKGESFAGGVKENMASQEKFG